MLEDDDKIYGEGFRQVKDFIEERGLSQWLELLKKKKARLPS